jgi:hypothetical protein
MAGYQKFKDATTGTLLEARDKASKGDVKGAAYAGFRPAVDAYHENIVDPLKKLGAGGGNGGGVGGPAAPDVTRPPDISAPANYADPLAGAQAAQVTGAPIDPRRATLDVSGAQALGNQFVTDPRLYAQASQIGQSAQSQQALAAQMGLIQQLQQQAAGQGPSLATQQLKQAQEAAFAQSQAQLAGARGGASPLLARQTLQARQAQTGDMARSAALARIQEQMGAREQLAGVSGSVRGQEQQLAAQQAQLQQQTDLANSAARQSFAAQNQAAELQRALQQGQIDQQTFNLAFSAAQERAAQNAQLSQQMKLAAAQSATQTQQLQNQQALSVQELQQRGMLGYGQLQSGLYGTQMDLYRTQLGLPPKQSMLGAAFGGGAQGAAAGSSFGPWGALAGGVLGAGAGAYGAKTGTAAPNVPSSQAFAGSAGSATPAEPLPPPTTPGAK